METFKCHGSKTYVLESILFDSVFQSNSENLQEAMVKGALSVITFGFLLTSVVFHVDVKGILG